MLTDVWLSRMLSGNVSIWCCTADEVHKGSKYTPGSLRSTMNSLNSLREALFPATTQFLNSVSVSYTHLTLPTILRV